jgi:hypothetical protein
VMGLLVLKMGGSATVFTNSTERFESIYVKCDKKLYRNITEYSGTNYKIITSNTLSPMGPTGGRR